MTLWLDNSLRAERVADEGESEGRAEGEVGGVYGDGRVGDW